MINYQMSWFYFVEKYMPERLLFWKKEDYMNAYLFK